MVELKTYKLSQIATSLVDGPFGSNLPASDYTVSGIPVIRGNNLSLGETRFKDDGYIFVSTVTAKRLERSKCLKGDIIFTKKGTLGQIGIIPQNTKYGEFIISSNQMKMTVNEKIADNYFVYYFLSSKETIDKIKRESESTGVPKINLGYLRNFEILLPDIKIQRRMSSIFSSIDDKIELNRRMNHTLEQIAATLFKKYFVDDIDPDNLPEGWHEISIGQLIEFALGGDWGEEKKSEIYSSKVAVIRGTDFDKLKNGEFENVPVRYIKEKNFEKRKLQDGDIIFEISGGSTDQPTGRNIRITGGLLRMLGGNAVSASFCRLVRPKNNEIGVYLSLYLSNLYNEGGTWEYQNQSTGISNFQFTYFTEKEKLFFPKELDIVKQFSDLVEPLLKKIENNTLEISNLKKIRDTLLPKLMCGEIDLSAIHQPFDELRVTKSESNAEVLS